MTDPTPAGPETPAPETGCQAIPLPGHHHDGQVRAYARICPAGHLRHGTACDACAGNRAVNCAECGTRKPAILIPAATWARLTAIELDLDAAVFAAALAIHSGQPSGAVALATLRAAIPVQAGWELTAEGAGPLLDLACRGDQCSLCPGAPCEHSCHTEEPSRKEPASA